VSAELAGNLLAASAVTHGLSGVVGDLTAHDSGSEFYSIEAPASVQGRSFGDVLSELKTGADALLIGVASNEHRYDLNPAADRVIGRGDRLLVIARRSGRPDRAPAPGRRLSGTNHRVGSVTYAARADGDDAPNRDGDLRVHRHPGVNAAPARAR
jgi:hypothetical protein